jgi:putative ABC transport system permease protein
MLDLARLRHAVRLGVRGITANALRSALTALGIVCGVAAVVVMLAIGEAARYKALKDLQDLGADTIVLKSQKPTDESSDKSARDLTAYGLTYADLDRLRSTIPTVKSATPMREFRKTVWRDGRKLDSRIVTVTPEFIPQNNIRLLRGRGIEPRDQATFANVAVISAEVAEQLFPAQDPIGKTITVEGFLTGYTMTVVGVTESKTLAVGGESGGEFTKVVFLPFETDRVRVGKDLITIKEGSESVEKIEVSQITLTVTDTGEVSRTAAAVKSVIDQFHPGKDVAVVVPLDLIRKTEETQRSYTFILAAIAGVSLVVGGIGIMNIMLASVTERTREIGIRRALGAKRRDIALQFLVETVVLSCGGGLLGLAVGVGTAFALKWLLKTETQVSVVSMVVAFVVSVLVGLVSGLYPARRAARLDPIEALRHT